MSTWAKFVQAASKHYKVITVDLLGHGGSDSPITQDRYRIERSIADIATLLKKLRVARPCWLGYSMGGRIALAAAALTPEQCGCLVLEGASPGLSSPNERAQRRRRDEALARLIMKKGVHQFTDHWERQPLFESQRSLPRRVREQIRKQRLRNNPIGLANTLRAANPGTQPPVHKLLPNIKIPVLCIVGEYDRKFKTIAKDMCNKLPNGRLTIIPKTGHAPHIEKTREFNSAVLTFLNETNWSSFLA
jgi:2-succinyl-6-hydroxy-2,4-cyclohexadiene-1-carboxylate synthase